MSQEDTNYNGYLDYEGEDFDSLVCQYDTLVMTNEIELSKIEDGFWCVIGENGHITLSGKFMNGKLINGLEYYYDEYDILLEVREIIPKKL